MSPSSAVRVMTPQEVAQHLQVSVRQVYRWIQDGELPAVRLGRMYRVQADDLQRFLLEHKTVRRSRAWRERFDAAMARSQAAFRSYLEAGGMPVGQVNDEEAERMLRNPRHPRGRTGGAVPAGIGLP